MRLMSRLINAVRMRFHRRKVDFIVVGVQKAGTTALYFYLRDHPQICMAKVKEVHFFDRDDLFGCGWKRVKSLRELIYHSYFPSVGKGCLVGEATPSYMYHPMAIPRIWEYNPKIKLLAVLRNPIERAYSHWNMERQRGKETLPFLSAIEKENERLRKALPRPNLAYSYLDRGFYTEQIRRLWRFFCQEQVLFIKHDDLLNRPNEVMNTVFDFLGVERRSVAMRIVHSRSYERKMTPEERKKLYKIYKHEIACIEDLLGWDCRDWIPE